MAQPKQRLAIVIVFFLVGLVAGVWAARIPAVKANLGLSNGTLGLALLGPAVGAVVAMPATGLLTPPAVERDHLRRPGGAAIGRLLSWRITALCVMAFGCYLA